MDFPDVNEVEKSQYKSFDTLIQDTEVYEIIDATKYTSRYNDMESENCKLELSRKNGDQHYIRGSATFTKMLFQDNQYMEMRDTNRFFLVYKGSKKSCNNFKYDLCLILILILNNIFEVYFCG